MKKILFLILNFLLSATYAGANSGKIEAYQENEKSNKTIRVINFWATWCQPCRKEMPEISKFAQKHKDIEVIGIALDTPENIQKFLTTTKISYSIKYHNQDAVALMKKYGNTVGGLPYTVLEAPTCNFRLPFIGTVNAKQLEQEIKKAKQQCQQKNK